MRQIDRPDLAERVSACANALGERGYLRPHLGFRLSPDLGFDLPTGGNPYMPVVWLRSATFEGLLAKIEALPFAPHRQLPASSRSDRA